MDCTCVSSGSRSMLQNCAPHSVQHSGLTETCCANANQMNGSIPFLLVQRKYGGAISRAHSPTFPSLHLRHNSFSNPSVALPTSQLMIHLSVASPTSQFVLQPFCHFTYVTAHSPTLPLLHLRHSSFSNPTFSSPTSQALHLIHLASRPCLRNTGM